MDERGGEPEAEHGEGKGAQFVGYNNNHGFEMGGSMDCMNVEYEKKAAADREAAAKIRAEEMGTLAQVATSRMQESQKK